MKFSQVIDQDKFWQALNTIKGGGFGGRAYSTEAYNGSPGDGIIRIIPDKNVIHYDRPLRWNINQQAFVTGYYAYCTCNWAQRLGWDIEYDTIWNKGKNMGYCPFFVTNYLKLMHFTTSYSDIDFTNDPTGLAQMIIDEALEMHAYGTVHKVIGKPTWNTIGTGDRGTPIWDHTKLGYIYWYLQRNAPYGYNSTRYHITPNIRTPKLHTPRGKRGYTVMDGLSYGELWGLPGHTYKMLAYEYTLWGDINPSIEFEFYPFEKKTHYWNDVDPFWHEGI